MPLLPGTQPVTDAFPPEIAFTPAAVKQTEGTDDKITIILLFSIQVWILIKGHLVFLSQFPQN